MKNTLKYLGTMFAMVLLMTGCGSKSAEDTFSDAIDKTKDVKNLHLAMKVDASVSAQGTTMGIGMNIEGEGGEEAAHFTGKVSLLGMEQEMEVYTLEKDNMMYSYQKDDEGNWTYTKEAINKEEMDTEEVLKKLKEYKSIKKVKSDKKGYTKLEVVYDGKKLNEATSDETVKETLGQDVKIEKDLVVNVYVKDGYISIISVDLGDLAKDLVKEQGYEVKATITIEMSKFNKVNKVTVPEEVLNNAKEEVE